MKPTLRVLLVEFAPSGGLFQYAYLLGAALAASGQDVTLLTGRDPELTVGASGFRIAATLPTWHPAGRAPRTALGRLSRRSLRGVRYVAAWLQVARVVSTLRPDVVQLADLRFGIDGVLVRLLVRRFRGVAFVDLAHTPKPLVEQRSTGSLYKESWGVMNLLGLAYRSLDGIVVLGESSRDELLRTWPDVKSVYSMPHGNYGRFVDEVDTVAPSGCPRRVVLFGTWTRYKGIDDLLRVWPEVVLEVPDAELVIAGEASGDVDVGAIQLAAASCRGVTLDQRYLPMDDALRIVSGARVVVAPYLAANQSGVVTLAQSLGRPVVATDVGDLGDLVRHDLTGLLIPPGDSEALAAALVRMLKEPETADRLGAAGRALVEREGSWSSLAEQFVAVYQSVLQGVA